MLMDKEKRFRYAYETADAMDYGLLKEHAKESRRQPTEAEALLWEQLRGNKLSVHFRRQHPIGPYIADFISIKKKLVVEVDGEYHSDAEQQRLDEDRSRYLSSLGYRVLRFTNYDVIHNMEKVLSTIIHSFN